MAPNPLWAEAGPDDHRCDDCTWHYRGGRGRAVDRCRRHGDQRLEPAWPACAAWTAPLDCADCGACCREAYHAVEVSQRDPVRRSHPELLVRVDGRWQIRREGPRCAGLVGEPGTFTCRIYEERPRTCRDFERGSANCVDARTRIGLTP